MATNKEFKLFERDGKWYAFDCTKEEVVVGPCETRRDAHLAYVIWHMTAVLNKEPGFEVE